jgi:hypothetical protein
MLAMIVSGESLDSCHQIYEYTQTDGHHQHIFSITSGMFKYVTPEKKVI